MIEAEVINAQVVNRLLRTVPRWAYEAIKAEMAGIEGLGVDAKNAIAGTWVGTVKGRKWVYSSKNKRKANQLSHFIKGATLDTVALTIFGKPPAELQAFGGPVSTKHGKYLWVPVGKNTSYADSRRRLRRADMLPGAIAFLRMKDGTLLVGERIATDKGVARGNDEKIRIYFILRKSVNHPGRRLDLRTAITRIQARTILRFSRAVREVEKRWREAA